MYRIKLLIIDLDKCVFDTFSMRLDTHHSASIPDSACSYGDEHYLGKIKIEKILVTTGYEKFQRAKAAKIGVERFFSEIIVDAIDDPATRKGKQRIFEEAMYGRRLWPWEIMVIGDNPESELKAGRALGMVTVQTLRPTIERWSEADHHISSFAELPALVTLLEECGQDFE